MSRACGEMRRRGRERVRRIYWTLLVAAAGWLASPARGAEPAPARTRITWPIPAVAWRVPIGGCAHGVPLGGFGAGSLMFNAGGTFGPWHFKAGSPEPARRLAGAAFHFYEKPEGGEATVVTLTSAAQMPGWTALPSRCGNYHALYPKGWFTYRCFTADLSLKFFSPILRGSAKETSLPVAVFEFEIANPTDKPLDVALLFTWPNAAAHTAELRSGFRNTPQADEAHRIAAVVLDARYEHNPPAAQDTEWCIAVRAETQGAVTHTPSWNALASGGDVRREFALHGRLPNKPLDATHSAAAVAFHTRLEPKATITVPFALSWDFPRVAFGKTLWWRRYTEHVGRESNHAYAIARDALLRHAEWEAAIDAWTRPILDEAAYPDWLKQAALNELYYNSFGGVFWEAGCITQPDEFKKLHPEDHKYFTLASPSQPLCEPLAARHAAQRHLLALWPQIERDVLLTYADLILDAENAVVHDLGSPAANPIFAYNAAPQIPKNAFDLPALFILQAHAYFRATADRPFLDAVWPACKKSFEALRAAAKGEALPRHRENDTVISPVPLQGVSLLGGGLWVAALEAVERMATVRGDRDVAAAARARLPRARRDLHQLLWRPQFHHYGLDTGSPHASALAAGALLGVRAAQAGGLEPILPLERVREHLGQVFARCVKPLRDHTGDGIGDCGAVNVVGTDGRPLGNGLGGEVAAATTYLLAATMYHAGKKANDKTLMDQALKTAYGAYYQTWVVAPDKPLWAFNTPQAWQAERPARARAPQHIGPRAIWELLLEIKNPYAPPPRKE